MNMHVPSAELGTQAILDGPAAQEQRRQEALKTVARLREEASAEIERLLSFMDETDGYTMTECEPSLGAPEIPLTYSVYHERYRIWPQKQGDQTHWAQGGTDDQEAEPEHDEDGNDEEPSLGSINPTMGGSQAHWSAGGATDLEGEHDGAEPDESGIADIDGYMEQCPGLFQHSDQRVS